MYTWITGIPIRLGALVLGALGLWAIISMRGRPSWWCRPSLFTFVMATLLAFVVASTAAVVMVREARTELVLEVFDPSADAGPIDARLTTVDGVGWADHNVLRRCSVARWINHNDGVRSDRAPDLREVEYPCRPWAATGAAMTALVALSGIRDVPHESLFRADPAGRRLRSKRKSWNQWSRLLQAPRIEPPRCSWTHFGSRTRPHVGQASWPGARWSRGAS